MGTSKQLKHFDFMLIRSAWETSCGLTCSLEGLLIDNFVNVFSLFQGGRFYFLEHVAGMCSLLFCTGMVMANCPDNSS